jgi:hypothetical protein
MLSCSVVSLQRSSLAPYLYTHTHILHTHFTHTYTQLEQHFSLAQRAMTKGTQGGSRSSSNSSQNTLSLLRKADNGQIIFEGRNFSKCVRACVRACVVVGWMDRSVGGLSGWAGGWTDGWVGGWMG